MPKCIAAKVFTIARVYNLANCVDLLHPANIDLPIEVMGSLRAVLSLSRLGAWWTVRDKTSCLIGKSNSSACSKSFSMLIESKNFFMS